MSIQKIREPKQQNGNIVNLAILQPVPDAKFC